MQRDLPSLLAIGGLRGVGFGDTPTVTAYAVLRTDRKPRGSATLAARGLVTLAEEGARPDACAAAPFDLRAPTMGRSLGTLLLLWLTLTACNGTSFAPEAKTPTTTKAPDVQGVMGLARRAHWTFPTSSGRPTPASAADWATRLVQERDTLVSTARALLERGHHALALELAANAWRTWVLAQDDRGGRAFLDLVLDAKGSAQTSRARALALYGASLFAFRLGDLVVSRARSEEALAVAHKVGDREAEGLALLAKSRIDLSDGRYEDARKHALASRATLADLEPAYGQAPLHMLAQATRFVGTLNEAAALFEESLALNRRLGDDGMVLVELHNLGHVELRRGNVDRAERCFAESGANATDDPYDQAMRLFNRASVAFARSEDAKVMSLLAEMHAVLRRGNVTLAADDQQEVVDFENRVRGRDVGDGDLTDVGGGDPTGRSDRR